jgi:hypothetical protein
VKAEEVQPHGEPGGQREGFLAGDEARECGGGWAKAKCQEALGE